MKIKILAVLFILIFILTGCSNSLSGSNDNLANQSSLNQQKDIELTKPAEKIEVVHFHGTHQCWSCITVGEYALKTIKEKFPEEYKNEIITYLDINAELPENKEIVAKYQANGSSLFVNAVSEGNDNIYEDIDVWRYVTNENQFIGYFQNKLKKFFGK